MAIAMDRFTMSQLGQLRWAAAHRRVRASVGESTVVDSHSARVVWEPFRVVSFYAVPHGDINAALVDPTRIEAAAEHPPILTPDHPFALHTVAGTSWTIVAGDRRLPGAGFTPADDDLMDYVVLDWSAFDHWRDEEQDALAHPHDPFQRIDCLASSRHVVVSLDGVVLADTQRPTLLLETHLPARYYIPREDVRMDLLIESATRSTCAYKGHARYFSARIGDTTVADVAWTYPHPLHDGVPVRDQLCFFDDRVRTDVT